MQVGTYPTRNFANLGPLWLQPPFTGDYIFILIKLKQINFTILYRAGLRLNTSFYNFAESCVFIKQSLPSILLQLKFDTQI